MLSNPLNVGCLKRFRCIRKAVHLVNKIRSMLRFGSDKPLASNYCLKFEPNDQANFRYPMYIILFLEKKIFLDLLLTMFIFINYP